MNLTRFTDYALRTLIHVGLRDDRLVAIHEVATAFQISKNHLLKVVNALGQKGFLATTRGRKGGLRLARPAAEIRVGDVVRAMEPGFDLLECFDPERDHCVITMHCKLKGALHRATRRFLDELDAVTLADLLRDRDPLLALLDGARPRGTGGKGGPGTERSRKGGTSTGSTTPRRRTPAT
jgi:Rrf2 family nitric oxide-sensitive transcriptional repressor